LYVGIDLGGTKISTALVSKEGRILERDNRLTAALEGRDAVIARMVDAARQVMRHAAPGQVAPARRRRWMRRLAC